MFKHGAYIVFAAQAVKTHGIPPIQRRRILTPLQRVRPGQVHDPTPWFVSANTNLR
jgi:hypothetical protein